MEFVVSLTGHLAWPITVIVMFFILRQRIRKLLEQLARFKYKDLELDFEKVRQQAEILREAEPPQLPPQSPEEPLYLSLNEQILETAERAPAAAIVLAWSTVEGALADATFRLAKHTESPSYRSPVHNIELLERQEKISRQQVELLQELRILRNKVAHDGKSVATISEAQALEYATAARSLVEFLNSLEKVYKIEQVPTGAWLELPKDFKPAKRKENANYWVYSNLKLGDTGLSAGVGPWKGGMDHKEAAYYGIDIEMKQSGGGSKVISELLLDLDLVAPEILESNANQVVQYDSDSRIVTFNLGRSVFRYELQ